jgi:hypothetical protein
MSAFPTIRPIRDIRVSDLLGAKVDLVMRGARTDC